MGSLIDTMQHLDICPCLSTLATVAFTILCSYLIYPKIWQLFLRVFTISYQMTGSFHGGYCVEDELYNKTLRWLGKNVKSFQTGRISVKALVIKPPPADEDQEKEKKSKDEEEDEEQFEGDLRQPPDHMWECQLATSAGYSTHYFQYKNSWIQLERKMMVPKITENGHYQEILTFTTWKWNHQLILDILEEAKPKAKKVDEKKLVVYKAVGGYWSRLGGPKKKRPLDTIILNGNVMDTLLKDIKNFLELEDWYIDRGIPYRRGYLLYGPPGCGKSSVIKALAGEIGYDICVFSLSQQMTDDSMSELMNQAPTKSIILLEDIDAAFQSRENPTSKDGSKEANNIAFEGASQSSLTFRGLLNALDGVGSAEDGLLVFMTTNYPERLDPALIRPGRVDLKMNIDYPNETQLGAIFERFYPNEEESVRNQFVKALKGLEANVSMAMVQGLMVYYKDRPLEAIEHAKEYFDTQFCSINSSAERIRGLYC